MFNHFHQLFQEVRTYLLSKGLQETDFVKENVKTGSDPNQKTLGFDQRVEEILINFLKQKQLPVTIMTEEGGEYTSPNPHYTLVIDPVDGSSNFKQQIEATAFSIAAIPFGKPIQPKEVTLAFVGSVWSGRVWTAEKGKGAFLDRKPIRASKETGFKKSVIGIDFNYLDSQKMSRVLPLMKACRRVRRQGPCALESAYVSSGAYDAYVDVRDMITAENYMASALLITEAGGMITDPKGQELPEIKDLSEPVNFVAAGNKVLHQKILDLLEME